MRAPRGSLHRCLSKIRHTCGTSTRKEEIRPHPLIMRVMNCAAVTKKSPKMEQPARPSRPFRLKFRKTIRAPTSFENGGTAASGTGARQNSTYSLSAELRPGQMNPKIAAVSQPPTAGTSPGPINWRDPEKHRTARPNWQEESSPRWPRPPPRDWTSEHAERLWPRNHSFPWKRAE